MCDTLKLFYNAVSPMTASEALNQIILARLILNKNKSLNRIDRWETYAHKIDQKSRYAVEIARYRIPTAMKRTPHSLLLDTIKVHCEGSVRANPRRDKASQPSSKRSAPDSRLCPKQNAVSTEPLSFIVLHLLCYRSPTQKNILHYKRRINSHVNYSHYFLYLPANRSLIPLYSNSSVFLTHSLFRNIRA